MYLRRSWRSWRCQFWPRGSSDHQLPRNDFSMKKNGFQFYLLVIISPGLDITPPAPQGLSYPPRERNNIQKRPTLPQVPIISVECTVLRHRLQLGWLLTCQNGMKWLSNVFKESLEQILKETKVNLGSVLRRRVSPKEPSKYFSYLIISSSFSVCLPSVKGSILA